MLKSTKNCDANHYSAEYKNMLHNVIKLMDSTIGTNLVAELNYFYIDTKIYTIKEIADIFFISRNCVYKKKRFLDNFLYSFDALYHSRKKNH